MKNYFLNEHFGLVLHDFDYTPRHQLWKPKKLIRIQSELKLTVIFNKTCLKQKFLAMYALGNNRVNHLLIIRK